MTILVTAASKHGSTAEIANAICDELNQRGVDAKFRELDGIDDLERFSGYVVGSAIYMGRWQAPAKEFLSDHQAMLRERPVWLFSSGPIGDAEGIGINDDEVTSLVEQTRALDHQIFGGKLDRGELGLGERLVTRVVRAPEGDYRNWDDIRAWADEIASSVQSNREST